MSRPARVALSAFVLACAMGLTGFVIQAQSGPGGASAYSAKIEDVRQDVRGGISLDFSRESILSNPKLEADRAALMKRIEQYQLGGANHPARTGNVRD